jgi:formate dehydrogenase subunit gamma
MTERPRRVRRIERFTFKERVVHWLAALTFVYAALSGLSLWSPHLYWIASVLGGGTAVRWGHPWGGVFFAALLGMMFLTWASQMRLTAEDRVWLRHSHKYAVHDEEGLPEPGRFNAGQKMLFWGQGALTLLLLATGIVLWFPEAMPRTLRLAAILLHPLAAVGAIGSIILHIYMGTAAVPGSLHAMIRGWVTPGWAAAHHRKWFREISKH